MHKQVDLLSMTVSEDQDPTAEDTSRSESPTVPIAPLTLVSSMVGYGNAVLDA